MAFDFGSNDQQWDSRSGAARRLDGTSIEIVREVRLSEPPRHVVFDFDGTLLLVREGWAEVMTTVAVEAIAETDPPEPLDEIRRLASDFLMALNGKPSIFQMMRLAEEVERRGHAPLSAEEYLRIYDDRLMKRVTARRKALASGAVRPEEMVVPSSFEILDGLAGRGVTLWLLSGTDIRHVREEARLLGLDRWFGERMYGAIEGGDYTKAKMMDRILRDSSGDGAHLIGFGDGHVETENMKTVGGTAVAVASNESARDGSVDPAKRERLIGAGADIVIPDYRDWRPLVDYIWGANASPRRED